jgi:hypothetical protein
MSVSCRDCGVTWTGLSRCHCSRCHNTFNSATAFDLHLPSCTSGEAVKLPRNADGYYVTKEYAWTS